MAAAGFIGDSCSAKPSASYLVILTFVCMTTRSGRNYKAVSETMGEEGIADLMKSADRGQEVPRRSV